MSRMSVPFGRSIVADRVSPLMRMLRVLGHRSWHATVSRGFAGGVPRDVKMFAVRLKVGSLNAMPGLLGPRGCRGPGATRAPRDPGREHAGVSLLPPPPSPG